MFTSNTGNFILSSPYTVSSRATIASVPSSVNINSGASKALVAQFYNPHTRNEEASPSTSLTGGVVSLFDAPPYVSEATNTIEAGYLVGGYSANVIVRDDKEGDDVSGSDAEEEAAKDKKAATIDKHLGQAVMKGQRSATFSPCGKYIYVVRTDTLALDWAFELAGAYDISSIQQIILIDAHRMLLLTSSGHLHVVVRPVGSEGTTFHETEKESLGLARKPNSDKFRYYLTKRIMEVSVSGASSSIVSVLPLEARHAGHQVTLRMLVVSGRNTNYSATTATLSFSTIDDVKLTATLAVNASSATSASFTLPSAPHSFAIVPPTSVEIKKKGAKKTADATTMTALVVPIGCAIPTPEGKPFVAGYLVAMSPGNETVESASPITVTSASGDYSHVTPTCAELLTENMLAIGLAAGSGAAPAASSPTKGSANSSPLKQTGGTSFAIPSAIGKVLYGTYYFEKTRAEGATIDASIINLTEEADQLPLSTSAPASSETYVPVGFLFNNRLSQQAVLVSSSRGDGRPALKLCGVSLVGGFPANGATISSHSWAPVISVATESSGSQADDRLSGKGGDGSEFVTINYPIVSINKASSASDPYRIRDAIISGRVSITAPMGVHARTLAQWPNAVIGVLKLLVDYTTNCLAISSPTSATSSAFSGVVSLFKSIATKVTGPQEAKDLETTIIAHAFHPSAIRNALRRLPFAVIAIATEAGAAKSTSATAIANGLFGALLDGVDATSLLARKASDSFLRSAVGAVEICHHIVTLQGQLGITLNKSLVSRYVLLLRSLRALGEGCDQIAGRLGATLANQRITAAHSLALQEEKKRIREYHGEGAATEDTDNVNSEEPVTQPRVDFGKIEISHKVASVSTGNIADTLAAQIAANKKIMDMVDGKFIARVGRHGKPVPVEVLPLYAGAGMRPLKSDYQEHYERYLLLGDTK